MSRLEVVGSNRYGFRDWDEMRVLYDPQAKRYKWATDYGDNPDAEWSVPEPALASGTKRQAYKAVVERARAHGGKLGLADILKLASTVAAHEPKK